MLYVRAMDKLNIEGERIDESYVKIARLIKARLNEVKFSPAYEHNVRLRCHEPENTKNMRKYLRMNHQGRLRLVVLQARRVTSMFVE